MTTTAPVQRPHSTAALALKAVLLLAWATVSFGVCFFARDLQFDFAGWPVNYWIAAQGSVLVFIAVVVLYAVIMNRIDPDSADPEDHG